MDALKKLQAAETEILREFVLICEKNNLQYFMAYGSALGTIRHEGFIPWDDDIDIAMPRDDYDKFIEIFGKINTGALDSSKHCKETFTIVNRRLIWEGENLVIPHPFIDIFPIYGLPDSFIKRWIHITVLWVSKKFLRISNFQASYNFITDNAETIGVSRGRLIIFEIIKRTKIYKFFNYDKIYAFAEALLIKYDYYSSKYCFSLWGPRIRNDVNLAETYGKGTVAIFEGIKVKVPKDYHRYLTKTYGNYMEPPPENQRKPHHDIKQIYSA